MVLIECPNIPAEHPREGVCILLHGPAAGRQCGGPLVRLERHPGRHAAALARRVLSLILASAKCAVACVDTAKVFVLRAIQYILRLYWERVYQNRLREFSIPSSIQKSGRGQ